MLRWISVSRPGGVGGRVGGTAAVAAPPPPLALIDTYLDGVFANAEKKKQKRTNPIGHPFVSVTQPVELH